MKERKSERKQSGAVRKSTTYGTKIFEKISENNIEGREEKNEEKKETSNVRKDPDMKRTHKEKELDEKFITNNPK